MWLRPQHAGCAMFPLPVALGAAILLSTTNALELDITQPDSIRDAASNIAYGMMSWYTGNNTGDVPGTYRSV